MPTYDYLCPNGHRFELFQRISDEPGADCPECGKAAERQISGGAGFLFKGDGFYITDYRSDEYKKKATAEAPGSGKVEGGSSGDAASATSGAETGSSDTKASSGGSAAASAD